jgi:hypothetical protein
MIPLGEFSQAGGKVKTTLPPAVSSMCQQRITPSTTGPKRREQIRVC